MKFIRCEGEGHGSCKRCTDNGKWNRMWMCFLYKIEGYEGCYCHDCVEELKKAECPECKHFVSCEPSTLGICAGFERRESSDEEFE